MKRSLVEFVLVRHFIRDFSRLPKICLGSCHSASFRQLTVPWLSHTMPQAVL